MVAQISHNSVVGYITVFIIEAVLLGVSLRMLSKVDVEHFRRESTSLDEQAALMQEAF